MYNRIKVWNFDFLDDAPNPMGFSPTVNQRILPPTFPRYTKIKARDVSISFFEELVQRTKQACKIIHCVNYHSALVKIAPTNRAIRFRFGLTFIELVLFFRTFLSSSAKSLGHVCYHVVFCNVCTFRNRIWCLELRRSLKCYAIRWKSFVRQPF